MSNTTSTQPEPLGYDPALLSNVAHAMQLRLVVLFGSWATSSPPPAAESDVDIAVLGCPSARFWECYTALDGVFPQRRLDLVRLEAADPLLRYEVTRQGILLAGDPDSFCEYRAFAYRDFVDSADLFALEQRMFEKKMHILGRQLRDPP